MTGETFNLSFEEIATKVAIKLKAEKLIGFCDTQGILDQQQQTISDLLPQDALLHLAQLIHDNQYHSSQARFLQAAIDVCRAGVNVRIYLAMKKTDRYYKNYLPVMEWTQLSIESSPRKFASPLSPIFRGYWNWFIR